MYLKAKFWPNNILKSNPQSTLASKPPVITTSNANFHRQSSQIINLNTNVNHLINPTSSATLNDVSKPSTTHTTSDDSNLISSSTPYQVVQTISKSAPKSRPNLSTLSSYKYRHVTDIKSSQLKTKFYDYS